MKNKNFTSSKFWTILSVFLFLIGNLKAQNAENYWIYEDFSTFTETSAWVQSVANYPTTPNNIDLTTYYANVEAADGNCNGTGKDFRVRGLLDNGYLTFTVPDAGSVTIEVKGKSTSSDRTVLIYRNDKLIETFVGLDRNHCVTFHENIDINAPVTYKITAGNAANTDPIVVSSIIVEKYTASPAPYVINASVVGGHGTISPNGQIEVEAGHDATFTATPDAGYKINVVRVDGLIVYMNHQNTYTFHNVIKNSAIEVSFIPIANPAVYWIYENFSDFEASPVDAYYQMDSVYLTYPNQIGLHAFYANLEESEGNCSNESLNFRIRGLADGGYVEFSVPNAQSVTIGLKGKSTATDRSINIYRNGELIDTKENLDRDHCATFSEDINSNVPVTYKITGGDATSTKPIVVSSIVVEKYTVVKINDNIKDQFVLYPNPVQDYVFIQNDDLSASQVISIFNLTGQCVLCQQLTGEHIQKIDLNTLPKGVYMVRITGKLQSYKLIKQ
jgi:hypothetical protein